MMTTDMMTADMTAADIITADIITADRVTSAGIGYCYHSRSLNHDRASHGSGIKIWLNPCNNNNS